MATTDRIEVDPADEARIRALPLWRERSERADELTLTPLGGGLSNVNYTVEGGSGKYVVRLGRDLPFHHVFREREIMSTRAAHCAGFAPELVYGEPGVMVSRFVEGVTLDEGAVRGGVERIAARIRDFHDRMPAEISGAAFLFWPFHVVRDYARTLAQSPGPWHSRLDEFVALNGELERVQAPMPIRFGHNDLLPANFIDDGETLWLIDYEYAGFSTAMFDLAGIASNAGFSAEQSASLLDVYFDGDVSDALRRSHAAMQCASLLRESMWSMVSHARMSTPGVDYVAYAEQNLAALEAAVDRYRTRYT